MRKVIYGLLLLFVASCSKNDDVIIPGNVPPPDHVIDSATIEIYINKVYINLLGREAIGTERADALTILKQNNFSEADREQFVATIFPKPEYNRNLYNIARIEYLANLDSTELDGQIAQYEFFLTQPQYAYLYDIINYELARMYKLKAVPNDMNAGTLDFRGMLQRCGDNYFYDQINMGTENFVVSTFQNFLFRYPTTSELANGKSIVDGNSAILFYQIGMGKDDYVSIFFASNDYYEGQVRYMFKKYMFREPSSAEMGYYTNVYKATDYKHLQKVFFSLDEYTGVD